MADATVAALIVADCGANRPRNRIDFSTESEEATAENSSTDLDAQPEQELEAALGTRTTLLHIAAVRGHAEVVSALVTTRAFATATFAARDVSEMLPVLAAWPSRSGGTA